MQCNRRSLNNRLFSDASQRPVGECAAAEENRGGQCPSFHVSGIADGRAVPNGVFLLLAGMVAVAGVFYFFVHGRGPQAKQGYAEA